MSALIFGLIILAVMLIAVILGCLSDRSIDESENRSNGEDCSQLKEPNSEIASKAEEIKSVENAMGEMPRTDSRVVDGAIADCQTKRKRFQLYGACAHRWTPVADWLRSGAELQVEISGDIVRASRNGRVVGIFPNEQAKEYLGIPFFKRYRIVVVDNDVNLNDKYGQCFVRPKY